MCYCPKILLGGRIEMREKMTNVEPIKNKKDVEHVERYIETQRLHFFQWHRLK